VSIGLGAGLGDHDLNTFRWNVCFVCMTRFRAMVYRSYKDVAMTFFRVIMSYHDPPIAVKDSEYHS